MKKSITFSQAVQGFTLNLHARHLSHHTIDDYLTTCRKFLDFLEDDPPIETITHEHIIAFLAAQQVSK